MEQKAAHNAVKQDMICYPNLNQKYTHNRFQDMEKSFATYLTTTQDLTIHCIASTLYRANGENIIGDKDND